MRHLISNEHLSLQHTLVFLVQRGYLKYDILHEKSLPVLTEMTLCLGHKGLVDASRSSSNYFHTSEEGYQTLVTNAYLSLQHGIQFPVLRGSPKADILHEFESCFWQYWHGVHYDRLVDAARSSSNYPFVYEEGYETLDQQLLSLLAVQHPISFWERGTQTVTFYEI